jgi:hypothetical protein
MAEQRRRHAGRTASRTAGLLLLPLLAAAPGPAQSAPPAPTPPAPAPALTPSAAPGTLAVRDVRPGMTGYGLTVFKGTQPERFPVRVIGVLHRFLPQTDIILIESSDPRLLHTGIAAGMSGSPIYLDGKLAGALAYGWSFNKDAVAGVTPIEYMLAEAARPLRGRPNMPLAAGPTAPGGDGAFVAAPPRREAVAALSETGDLPARHEPLRALGEEPLPAALARLLPPPVVRGTDPRLHRATVPLALAGVSERVLDGLRGLLEPFDLALLAGAGNTPPDAASRGPAGFEPGGAIAVQLIRGDISAAGTGTVTHVAGSKVLGFGHPMFSAGEVYFPVATAEIVHILSSQSSSFKMSRPLVEKGTLQQDRPSCIVADTSSRAPMLPVQVTVRTPGLPDRLIATEVASHRALSPLLMSMVLSQAVQQAAPDVADAVVRIDSRLDVRGFAPLVQTDHLFLADGLSPKALLLSSAMRQTGDVLLNPFGPARIERLEMQVSVEYKPEVAEIAQVTLASDELQPDTRPSLYVTLRPYGAVPTVRAIPFEVPRALAGQLLKIEVAAGAGVKPDVAPPEHLGDLIENLRKGYTSRQLVVTLSTSDEGVTLRGKVVPGLPASVIATLRPGSASKRGEIHKRVLRFAVDAGLVVQGKQELSVMVKDEPPR